MSDGFLFWDLDYDGRDKERVTKIYRKTAKEIEHISTGNVKLARWRKVESYGEEIERMC